MKKRFALISDIHSNSQALEEVIKDIKKRNINTIYNLGDSVYGPLNPARTAEILIEENIPSVLGNEDQIIYESKEKSKLLEFVKKNLNEGHIDWLKKLKKTMIINDEILMFHGTPTLTNEYLLSKVTKDGVHPRKKEEIQEILKDYNEKIILCAHDHTPKTLNINDGRVIINPGSVGCQAYTDDNPFYHIIQTGSPHARYSIVQSDNNKYEEENVLIDYDWNTAALVAEENGFADWGVWIKEGRIDK